MNLLLVLAASISVAYAAKKPSAPASLPPPQATFAYPTFTAARTNPSLWGTATNLHGPLTLSVTDRAGVFQYSKVVATTSGAWSAVVYPQLLPGIYKLSLFGGTTTLAQAQLAVGVSSPQIDHDFSLGRFDVSDGKLMRFSVAGGSNGTSLGQLTFSIVPNNVSLDSVTLYGFTDTAYSQPLPISADGSIATAPFDPTAPLVSIDPMPALFIPPNTTYYFELDGTVTPGDTAYSVTTQLLSDNWLDSGGSFGVIASSSNVAWSPNSFGSSTLEDGDWLNASTVSGLYPIGITEERYATPTLGCSIDASTSTISSATPVTITWDSSGADNAAWAGGGVSGSAGLSGSVTVVASSTRTFILNFWGPLGATQCYTTVTFAQPGTVVAQGGGGTSTTTAIATAPLGTIAASPASGLAPLTTTISGKVNNNNSCSASTYTLGFGDKSTTTIAVAKNVCKPQSYSFSHRYMAAGTYIAKLYAGAFSGNSAPPLVASTTIVVTNKVALSSSVLIANVFDAFEMFWVTFAAVIHKR